MWGCRRDCTCLVVAVLLGVIGGCGEAGRPVKVTGIVTLDGVPVQGAIVTFQPAAENGQPASGFTDEKGAFRLATRNDDGAFPGQYKVVVTKREMGEDDNKKRAKSVLPKAYGSRTTTPLSCTVPPPGSVALELKSKP